MGTDDATDVTSRAARRTTLALEALTAVGAVAGVQGFLVGAFDPLVDQLHDAWPVVAGRVLPAVALGAAVALPQGLALVLGVRRHPRAADVGLVCGAALTAWVTLQLPLIGWGSPVQWVFAGVGVVQVAAATAWRRHERRSRATEPSSAASRA
ncbi:hypothetical protein [Cellulomonas sp. S1-8]|uniref:hypothetical protein n=1 Tax=Cellulomonas sp. S1-8 TaxID=2904790 RepID=UPI002244CA80|nr:hypothetical protein [Cellulomonas sp. S1-8]UZN04190.1 hypothetical protein OKX07_04425 [Cellulomonas sp. S1-8]